MTSRGQPARTKILKIQAPPVGGRQASTLISQQHSDHSAGGRNRLHHPAYVTHVRLAEHLCGPHAMPPTHESISQNNAGDLRSAFASTAPLRSARRSTAESARHGWDSRTKVAAAASVSVRMKGHACRCKLCTSSDRHTLCAGYKRWF